MASDWSVAMRMCTNAVRIAFFVPVLSSSRGVDLDDECDQTEKYRIVCSGDVCLCARD